MGLRTRLTLLAAGVVGITVVLASVVCYLAMRGELRDQVDDALGRQGGLVLQARGEVIGSAAPADRFSVRIPAPPPRAGGSAPYVQILDKAGKVERRIDAGLPKIPVTARDRRVAAGKAAGYLSDRVVAGDHVRVNTVQAMDGGAFQLGRSLAGVDSTLSRLRWVLLALCVLGTALAAALGRLFSRPVMQPVTDLTDAAEHITATEDLARRVDARGDDEVGRMAARFNTMLDTLEGSRAALDDSVEAQRRLVADASHELRTPVTSLRTNVEVLLAGHDLPDATRRRLLEDVREQTEELSALITDVIELARGEVPLSGVEDVRLDDLVRETVAKVGRHHPGGALRVQPRANRRRGPPRPAEPRGREPLGQRGEVRAGRRRGGGGRGRRRRDRPRRRTGRARRRGAVRVRPLLPRRRRPRPPGLRAGPGDRAAGGRGARGVGGGGGVGVHVAAACGGCRRTSTAH